MKNKFLNLYVRKIIIHKIFKRDDTKIMKEPYYSPSCCKLNDGFRLKIQDRIVRSMGNESHSIHMEVVDDSENSVYKTVTNYWLKSNQDEKSFINMSKEITKSLACVQESRKYPDSIIICVEGTVQALNKPFFGVIKAESQDGFSIIENNDTLGLNYINDLFMTKNEKYQKIGIFINNAVKGRDIEAKDIDAFIFDCNTDKSISKSKAEYFYKSFLGLGFRKDSNLLTNNFYINTKKFIQNAADISNTKKIKLITSLLDYLNSDAVTVVNAKDFASNNFDDAVIVDNYIKYLSDVGVNLNSIHKDLSMLGKQITIRHLEFSNKVKIQIPVDEFSDSVTIDEERGETVVKIKGMILNEK